MRDDQPEGTQVFILDTSSPELIEKLIRRRYPHVSQVDARTIADASGGDAPVAIALAETVKRSETIAGLSDESSSNDYSARGTIPTTPCSLQLRPARSCTRSRAKRSMARGRSFRAWPHSQDRIPQKLIATSPRCSDAVLSSGAVFGGGTPGRCREPLAARALEDTPYNLINEHLVEGGIERLARSFSRRLSFLHDQARAIAIVESWLAPGGFLGDVAALDELGSAMLENVAPVLPRRRWWPWRESVPPPMWPHGVAAAPIPAALPRLRPGPFDRSAGMLVQAATENNEREDKQASDTFVSLFTIHLSGTHATIEQRLGAIERLLRSRGLRHGR